MTDISTHAEHGHRQISMFEMGVLTQSVNQLTIEVRALNQQMRQVVTDIAEIKQEKITEKRVYRGMIVLASAIGSVVTIAFEYLTRRN